VPLWGREVRAVAEASRASRSPDSWAIGDIANSAAAAVMGSDYRNYYRSDRVSLTVGRNYWRPLISPESWLGPRAGIQVEKATSVDQRATWSLFHGGGLDRENPPIDEGTIVSAIVGFGYKKRWPTSRFDGDAQAERGIASAGDFGFTQFTADGHYQARTFRMHTLDVRFHTVLPIAGDSAPRQRWYILGGSPTLPTVGVGHYRGDHLAYVASTYGVPLPLMLPFIGQPTAEAWYATGAAWVTGDRMPRWTQNLGAGVSFPLVHVRVVIDPASDRLSPKLQAWVSVPGT
jgi:hypothetical protein